MMADLRMQEMFLVQREEETNCHANALQLRQVKLVEARQAFAYACRGARVSPVISISHLWMELLSIFLSQE